MFGLFKTRHDFEWVEFPRATLDPPRHCVTLEVTAEDCLTPEELRQLDRFGLGVKHWWLRWQGQDFAALDLPPGDTPFTVALLLPHGLFTLGVGRPPHERRIAIQVTSDGSLRRLTTRTDAQAHAPS